MSAIPDRSPASPGPQLQAVEEECSALSNAPALWKQLNDGLAKQNPLNFALDEEVSSTGFRMGFES
jgi:hypothetical protein